MDSDILESVQRVFIKKIFRLPQNTPNYVLYTETFFEKIHFYTIQLNINYLAKVLSLPEHRYPNLLARQAIAKNVYWYRDWRCLGSRLGLAVELDVGVGGPEVRSQLWRVAAALMDRERAELVGRARTSVYHQQYRELDLDLGHRSFLADNNNIALISWAIKARAELINLNFKPWLLENNHNCSLCNLQEFENVYHFVAKCPILAGIRSFYFQKNCLDNVEFKEYLNGKNWRALSNYLKAAWDKRWELVSEFNN